TNVGQHQPAGYLVQPAIQRLVEVASGWGAGHDGAHEDKHGNGNISQIGYAGKHGFGHHVDDIKTHVEKQSGNGGQAQRKGNGHAGYEKDAQPRDQCNPGNHRSHGWAPESFSSSATYCMASRKNPITMGVNGIHRGIADTLGVVQPPSIASNRWMAAATIMTAEKARPMTAPIRSRLRRVRRVTSI